MIWKSDLVKACQSLIKLLIDPYIFSLGGGMGVPSHDSISRKFRTALVWGKLCRTPPTTLGLETHQIIAFPKIWHKSNPIIQLMPWRHCPDCFMKSRGPKGHPLKVSPKIDCVKSCSAFNCIQLAVATCGQRFSQTQSLITTTIRFSTIFNHFPFIESLCFSHWC